MNKKVFGFIAGLLVACVARADYMLWQVNSGTNPGAFSYAALYAVNNGNSQLLSGYLLGDSSQKKVQAWEASAIDTGKIVVSLGSDLSSYSFYIELYNGNWDAIKQSSQMTAEQLKSINAIVDSVNFDSDFNKLNAFGGTQSNIKWNPVPEPTSAFLLLMGAACLAMKRRRA